MERMSADGQQPHVTRVVGTPEFIKAWKRLEAAITQGRKVVILAEAELVARQAYLDGFDEGMAK
jgi:hypothetical protein